MLSKLRARLLLVFLLISGYSGLINGQELPPLTSQLTVLKNQTPAPALSFLNLDEEVADLAMFSGKVVVVNFWATWCPPCRREMASIERLYQATKDKNVEILAVNIGEDFDTVFSFLGVVEPTPTFPILLDTNAESMSKWRVMGLPTTFVIDPQGNITHRAVGGRNFDHPDIIETVLSLTGNVGG